MKHTLIVTLIASAIELMALQTAQAACLANGATPIVAGPLNPVTGFPDYLTDANGLSLQRCVDTLLCSPSPVVAADPFSVQIGSGAEAPWWRATSTVFDTPGNPRLLMTFAALSTFGKTDPLTGAPIDGSQQPVLRQRLTLVAPAAGLYTVNHPYGQELITVSPAEAGRDLVMTVDRGFAANSSVSGPVGPFLSLLFDAPPGFIGAIAAPDLVTGSPCDFNAVSLSGVDADGLGLDIDGHGGNIITTDLFTVQGQRYDGRTQTPLSATRLTYSRAAASIGQIDAFAHSSAGALVSVQDGAATAPVNARLATPVALGHALAVTGGADNSASSVLSGADTAALPPVLRLSAVDAGADPATDPTIYVQRLVDFVQISRADYDPNTQTLFVDAASGDQRVPPTLSVRGYASAPGTPIQTPAPPALVTVDSSAGGSDSALVRVITLQPPLAPSGLVVAAASSRTLRLNWVDNSGNETTFDVYRGEVKLASLAPNTTTYTDVGLVPGAFYIYRIVAVNSAGANGTDTLDAATLALPATPGAPVLLANPARTISASWADNSADETGFQLQRASAVAGPFAAIVNSAANVNSAADNTVTLATTYFYRVVALRGVDSSEASPVVAITTPGLPSAPTTPSLVAGATGTSVALSWSDSNVNETGFQVQRRVGTGAFVPVGGVLAPDSISFVDSTITPGSSVSYRVDVINWAGTTSSAVSAAVSTPNPAVLQAPGNFAASTAVSPVLTWADTSSGETAYRVRRFPVTVAANGSITTGASNLPASGAGASLAANSLTFTDNGKTVAPAPTKDAVYKYEVAALNGASVGPLATVYTAATAGGLPTANRPTLTRSLVGTAPNQTVRVTVTWTAPAPTTGIGGWELQRCTGVTCTNFVKLPGTALNSAGTVDGRATLTFADNSVARATAYSYRLRAVGGAGTGLSGAFGPSQTVTTQ